jgi:hydrogenase expression/formation protein HypC
MCLAVPAKVLEVNGATARVEIGGNIREANLSLVEDAKAGDYIMLHAGFAIAKYEPEEALRTLELLKELANGAA